MSSPVYGWDRFWIPRGTELRLDSDGFLSDLADTSLVATASGSEYLRLKDLDEVPCLILLGEPGTGKTTVMTEVFGTVYQSDDEAEAIHFNLNEYSTDQLLVNEIFQGPTIQNWLHEDGSLTLFLDSLDECLVKVTTLAALLGQRLAKLPTERLRLRIACRTAEWPVHLEERLVSLWGEGGVKVLEICPLRVADVLQAADVEGVDPAQFMEEVKAREVGPIAARPVTLRLLFRQYKQDKSLPATRREIYLQGCRALTEEVNLSRRTSRLIGSLTSGQRICLASRIAAATVYSNRSAIWTGSGLDDVPTGDIRLDELEGGSEPNEPDEVRADRDSMNEVLSTGLFRSWGVDRLGWAHQTYAEFLAAYYISKQHEMPLVQVLSLLLHPVDRKVIPQLREVTAWIAAMRQDVFQEIAKADPETLLRGDLGAITDMDRALLTDHLLQRYGTGDSIDTDWDMRHHYSKLLHPSLDDQLRPYICEPDHNFVVRRVAIDIAEACGVTSLLGELVDLTLDPARPHYDRVNAVHAVAAIGDSESVVQLKPLLNITRGDDPDDELRGYALRALWPGHMSVGDVLASIHLSDSNLWGAFTGFLSTDFFKGLFVEDLPAALDWTTQLPSGDAMPFRIKGFVDGILRRGLEHLDQEDVLKALARAIWARLKTHDVIVGSGDEYLAADSVTRMVLLRELVKTCERPEDRWFISYSQPRLVMGGSIDELIRELASAKLRSEQETWADLIARNYDRTNAAAISSVIEAAEKHPFLDALLGLITQPIQLNSVRAKELRASYESSARLFERPKPEQPVLDPPPGIRVLRHLDAIESGDVLRWWQLACDLELEETSVRYRRSFDSDISTFPGWRAAKPALQMRILETAVSYLLEATPDLEVFRWREGNRIKWHGPTYAGYKALRLILDEAPQLLSKISDSAWSRWAPVILGYPAQSDVGSSDVQKRLACLAYREAPTATLTALDGELRHRIADAHELSYLVDCLDHCWDRQVSDVLLAVLADTRICGSHQLGYLMRKLLVHDVPEARDLAVQLISAYFYSEGTSLDPVGERSAAIVAVRELLRSGPRDSWDVVWNAINQDSRLGMEVMRSVASSVELTMSWMERAGATVGQMADLYAWLEHHYPEAEDPGYSVGVATTITPRHEIADIRNGILKALQRIGSFEACAELQRLSDQFPHIERIRWMLPDALAAAREATWVPPAPRDIYELANSSVVRIVQSGDQLLEVVMEVLDKLQVSLHGETPAVFDLWNEDPVFRPKKETAFSDWLKRQLEAHLVGRHVILSREVEIRRRAGGTPGEETDIHISALNRASSSAVDTVSMIIEVKGNWNAGLFKDMERQLVGRYLKDNQSRHGLYVVGWFNCDQWDREDSRNQRAPKTSINETRARLTTQAEELSVDGITVRSYVLDTALPS